MCEERSNLGNYLLVKVAEIVKTCEACPAQWEGLTNDNCQIYVRYRWGCLSIRIGKTGDMSEFGGVRGDEILYINLEDPYDGVMEFDELKTLSAGIVEFP